jgi:hypothetical protein
MFGRRIEIVLAIGKAPGVVMASEMLLERQPAVADDDDGMNVGVGGLQPGGNAAKARAVDPEAFG